MDLSSGYLLLEDISDDRRFETGYAKTSPRLEALGIEVTHALSDRAKALIKLAVTGFECSSGADLFHAQRIRIDCVSVANHNLIRLLDEPGNKQNFDYEKYFLNGGLDKVSYIGYLENIFLRMLILKINQKFE